MRTTLDIDDEVLAAVLARHPGTAKTGAIERALRAHLRESTLARLREVAGGFPIDDVSEELRERDRCP